MRKILSVRQQITGGGREEREVFHAFVWAPTSWCNDAWSGNFLYGFWITDRTATIMVMIYSAESYKWRSISQTSLNIHFFIGPSPNNRVVDIYLFYFRLMGDFNDFPLLELSARGKKLGFNCSDSGNRVN